MFVLWRAWSFALATLLHLSQGNISFLLHLSQGKISFLLHLSQGKTPIYSVHEQRLLENPHLWSSPVMVFIHVETAVPCV